MEEKNHDVRYPLCLVIMDGWGCSDNKEGNAILAADTPNYDRLLEKYPGTLLNASGLSVGLPEGQMGNSEVGHLNIGAGRIVYQELTKITRSIELGKFYEKEAFLEAIKNVNENNPCQVFKCPFCGEEITANEYHIEDGSLKIICPNDDCFFKNGLPIYVIDTVNILYIIVVLPV